MYNSQQQLITNNPQMQFMERGYTGHEHMQTVGLINMNARIYDPIVRKFLSADNIVSDPFNTQSYDRYSYVLNNPLLYADINGHEIGLATAVVIGVAVAIFSKAITNMISDIPFWYGMGKAATIGAVSAAISFGIGSIATTPFGVSLGAVGRAAFEAGMHAISGGAMSAIDGGKFVSGMLSGAVSSLMSSGIRALGNIKGIGGTTFGSKNPELLKAIMITSGGLSGGISSTIAGGKFIDGLRQGLITSGLNHALHMGFDAIQEHNKLEDFLKEKGISYNDQGKLATVDDLIKLKEIFKDLYWDKTAQWAEIATEETLLEWSKDYLKYTIDERSKLLKYTKSDGDTDYAWGVTNPINGKIILAPALLQETVYSFTKTFIHESVHSIDFMLGYLNDAVNAVNEVKAYLEVSKWTDVVDYRIKEYVPGFSKFLLLIPR